MVRMTNYAIKSYCHPYVANVKKMLGPIIIIGSHRSGTGLLNQLLELLSVHMGDVQEANHESVCFLRVNDELLRSVGANWANPEPFLVHLQDKDFVGQGVELARKTLDKNIHLYGKVEHGQHWGWKDPRTTLTLSIWLRLFPKAKVVHIVRNGIDVGLSLMRREQRRFVRRLLFKRPKTELMFPPTFTRGYSLWSLYVNHAVANAMDRDNYYEVRYEDILQNPVNEMSKLVSFLGISTNERTLLSAAEGIIQSPTRRSVLENLLVRSAFTMRLVDDKDLLRWGYGLDA